MARLEYTTRDVNCPSGQAATVVELTGTVDPGTLDILQRSFDELLANDQVHVIYDLHKLKYINSTGMGMMVQFVDDFTERGGGLVLMNVQPKVLLVIEMLGLQELFRIVPSEDDATRVLDGQDAGPSSVQVQLEAEDIEPIEDVEVVEAVDVDVEPVGEGELACEVCAARMGWPGPGAYRCPRCRTLFKVEDDGGLRFFPESKPSLEMSLPPRDDLIDQAAQLAATAAVGEEGASSAQAVSGCLRKLRDLALNGAAPQERLQLFVESGDGVRIRLYCGGKLIEANADEAFDPFRTNVKSLRYEVCGEGNLVVLDL